MLSFEFEIYKEDMDNEEDMDPEDPIIYQEWIGVDSFVGIATVVVSMYVSCLAVDCKFVEWKGALTRYICCILSGTIWTPLCFRLSQIQTATAPIGTCLTIRTRKQNFMRSSND